MNKAAAEFKISRQSAGKWVKRYRELGLEGLTDRSSRPHHLPTQTAPAGRYETRLSEIIVSPGECIGDLVSIQQLLTIRVSAGKGSVASAFNSRQFKTDCIATF